MRNIIFILISTLLGFCSTVQAQEVSDGTPAETIVKWSPLSLLNPVIPAVQFGVEHQVGSSNWTHQHELGFFWDGNKLYDGQFWGIRLHNEMRYYIPRSVNFFDLFFDRYVSLQVSGRHLNYRNEEVIVWRDRAYRQLLEIDANQNELGLLLGTGKVIYFEKVPIIIEYGNAIGVRFINTDFYNLPLDTETLNNNNTSFWDPLDLNILSLRSPSPMLNLYFKVGYILK